MIVFEVISILPEGVFKAFIFGLSLNSLNIIFLVFLIGTSKKPSSQNLSNSGSFRFISSETFLLSFHKYFNQSNSDLFSVKEFLKPNLSARQENISKSDLDSPIDEIVFLLAIIVGSLGLSIISFLSKAVFAGRIISACLACAFHQISFTIIVFGICQALTNLFKS